MRICDSDPELNLLLQKYDTLNGAIDYVFFDFTEDLPQLELHRSIALAGMAELGERRSRSILQSSYWKELHLPKPTFQFAVDETKLRGEAITYSMFWGNDDIERRLIANETGFRAWSIPEVDGYKTAFFHPPHGLRATFNEQLELFSEINRHIFGTSPESAEIYSWSTDWSDYFDAGHEWWGAFFWSIRPRNSRRMTVIGASSTD